MKRHLAVGPYGAVRARAVTALLVNIAIIAVLAVFASISVDLELGLDLFFGGIVVILPQAWLALQLGARGWIARPALLAVAKYTLTGAGFAVLFALKPEVNGLAVMIGAMVAIGVTPAAYHLKKHKNVVKSD